MVEMERAWRWDKGRGGETVESDDTGCGPAESPTLGSVRSKKYLSRVRDSLFRSATGTAGGGVEGGGREEVGHKEGCIEEGEEEGKRGRKGERGKK